MISFVVIGKNEGWRLKKCFEAIYNVIEIDKIANFEIIYVDSRSTDNSLEMVRHHFPNVRRYIITGKCNAAIARNIGAKESEGSILFFIDGDMEIQPNLLPLVIQEGNLTYPFISGICIDYNYDVDWQFLDSTVRNRFNKDKDRSEMTTGGLFIIEKKLWHQVGGMDTRFKRNQDLDLGLRLANEGYPLLRKRVILAKHHTIPYTADSRIRSILFSIRYTALLTRKHLINRHYWSILFRTQYSAFFLLILLASSFLWNFVCILLYLPLVYFRASKTKSNLKLSLYKTIVYFTLRDILFITMLCFFYPFRQKIEFKTI